MKTIKQIWNIIKLFFMIPIQLIAGFIMLFSILLFAIATFIESPSGFMTKLRIVKATIVKIFADMKVKRLETKINKQYNGEQ